MIEASEREPFRELAAQKGWTLHFGEAREDECAPWMVDVDCARLSIANAMQRARTLGLRELEVRLDELLRSGSAVEHVDFAAAHKSVYFFAEDVEKMARAGPFVPHPRVVHEFSWIRCSRMEDGSQLCAEVTRRICIVGDPVCADTR